MKTRKNQNFDTYLKKISTGVILSIVSLILIFAHTKEITFAEIFFYETMPNYRFQDDFKTIFSFNTREEVIPTFSNSVETKMNNPIYYNENASEYDLIGLDDVMYQDVHEFSTIEDDDSDNSTKYSDLDLSRLADLGYLRERFYIVERGTDMIEKDFDIDRFLNADLTIDTGTDDPKVLIFHTHSQEMFSDSANQSEGIVGAGAKLAEILENKYGLKTIHDKTAFDIVNGRTQITGAYEVMEPVITRILEENPSIELVIDLHRDGVPETTRLVQEVNGKPTAQIMFVNGLSKMYREGVLTDIGILPNPNLSDNLALSFNLKLEADRLYPGFSRKVFLKPYRYSLHMRPKSILVELGAQTNTKEEAFNAIEPLADIIANVVLKQT